MSRLIAYFIFLVLLVSHVGFAQSKPVPKKNVTSTKKHPKRTDLGIGLGVTRSVVYLARNVKPNNDATGLNASLVYGGSRIFRVSLEYTRYAEMNMAPTWYDVKANTIELNGHVLARFKNKNAYFYPLFGISYNRFSGFYTGNNDFLRLDEFYQKNTQVSTNWLGLNVGTGYELYFKPGSFFLDYKMRIGVTKGYNQINIQDVCISAGLRFNLRAPSVYSLFTPGGLRSRYLLDKSDEK
jgi:hypothetical protein